MNTILRKMRAGLLIPVTTILLLSCSDDDTTPNDANLPDIQLSSSFDGTTVWNTVTLVAQATDDQGIDQIELKIDGTSIGTSDTSPYEFEWNTLSETEGDHTVTAIATDKAGNQKSVDLILTVKNILIEFTVDADMLTLNDEGYQARGFVFLSDNDGKVIVAKEYTNGESVKLSAPTFDDSEFSITEVLTLDADDDLTLITTTHVNRGNWVLNNESEIEENATPIGYANLLFNNLLSGYTYNFYSNGLKYSSDFANVDKRTVSLGLSVSPSLLYAQKIDQTSGEITFNVFPQVTVGTNLIDLAEITNTLTTETLILPANTKDAYITTRPLRTSGSQVEAYGYIYNDSPTDGSVVTFKYPGDAFSSYFSETEMWDDDNRTFSYYNRSKAPYDITPLNATLEASLNNGAVTISASGTMDFCAVYFDQAHQSWAFINTKSVTTVVMPEIPEILASMVKTNWSTDNISITAEDFPQVDGFDELLDFVRASQDGYYDLWNQKFFEEKIFEIELTDIGGRKGTSKKPEIHSLAKKR